MAAAARPVRTTAVTEAGARAAAGDPALSLAHGRCPHCGAPVEGAADSFCCAGCEGAYAIIRGAGLERYYADREAYAPRPEGAASGWASVPTTPCDDGAMEARLMVDGLRCASCVWLVERVLEGAPGVRSATVSYASGRAALRWDPRVTDLPALAGRIAALGYRPRALGEERRADRALMIRFGAATFLSLNIMGFYDVLYLGWIRGMDAQWQALFQWVSLALATPIALWCAAPFYEGAIAGLRRRVLHMDLPIALGVALMYLHGVVQTIRLGETYLDSLGMLVAALLGGRLLESRGRRRAAEAATMLAAQAPRTARRARDGIVEEVPVTALRAGDTIDVGTGEELPADGVVTHGRGLVRMALVTGEAEPVPVSEGSAVVGGTLLADGAISVRVEAVGAGTVLHRMAAQLEAAADRGMRPSAADRIAPAFTAATLLVALLTLGAWWWLAGAGEAIGNAVAVLVVACPCALALSQPLAGAAGLGAAARRGLLLRDADALLELGRANVAALDKTGTVTQGAMTVTLADDATLRIAAGLERYSGHPIARAIVAEATARGIPLPTGTDVAEEPGRGIAGTVDGRRWQLRSGAPGAGTVELVAEDGGTRPIRLGDAIRPDAADAVDALRRDGLEVALLTGDHEEPARRIAGACGIAELRWRATPEDKVAWVQARRARGDVVLFAGDGVNDAPALATADVGIAMGTGAATSVLAAAGVISAPSLAPLLAGRRAARAAERAIRFNQRLSIGYNVGAVALAAAGLVNPLVAALLMPLSSSAVIWGAARVEALVRREEQGP
ncbi:MAG TPA: heavy metal translocating P-type ATPase [Gemmatimonadaceae bacterium]